jgi:hypothetical protein
LLAIIRELAQLCEAEDVACPVCDHRKARRSCPALQQTICTVCCGTKRLVEISCPPDCAHLAAAREHPAAVVKRQQERDVALLMPTLRQLTERQHQLFFLFHGVIARHAPEGFARLNDDDVAQAAGAVASTLETASRGVIYEHAADSPVAQRLGHEFRAMLEEVRAHETKVYDAEAALALRAIETGARETRARTDGSPMAYLALMGRLLQVNKAAGPTQKADAPAIPASPIVRP